MEIADRMEACPNNPRNGGDGFDAGDGTWRDRWPRSEKGKESMMGERSMSRAVVFAVVLPALLVVHDVADHWVQTHRQACTKGSPGWAGRTACAAHVATYTATTALTVGALKATLGLPITPRAFIAGQLVSVLTHYWADRRFTLARLCEATGKGGFYRLGAPREGRDDNPTLGTGAYALDQSWHKGWLRVAALVTAAGAPGGQ